MGKGLVYLLCAAGIFAVGAGPSEGLMAQGKMTKREAPPMPGVDARKCVIDGPMSGYPSEYKRIKNRAEDQAKSLWEKEVNRKYGRLFAKWKNASSVQGKDVICKSADRAIGKVWSCYAKATPCLAS